MQVKLSAHRFQEKVHLPIMKAWLERRKMPVGESIEFLPPTGVVIYFYLQPVCMGFMIKCDNGMAINTDLISDPEIPDVLRNEAVEKLRKCLYNEAKAAGLKMVSVFTSHPSHVERLKSLGYKIIDKNLTQLGRFLWQ